MYSIKAESFVDRFGTLLFNVSYKGENGEVIEKRVGAETFAQLISGNLIVAEELVEVPKLPDIFYKTKVSPTKQGSFETLLVFKAQIRGFSYLGEPFFIPFPALLMKLKFVDGVRQIAEIYALDTDHPTNDSKVYCYPFGNVDPQDGHICFGNISMDITSVEDAPKVFQFFIEGQTNNDLYDRQNTEGLTQEQLIKKIKDLETYPTYLLKENGKTIKELWK